MEISKSRWYSQLYVQVLIGIVIGAAIGHFEPQFGAKLQPFADGFIKLIKMLLAPIIFGTVVVGICLLYTSPSPRDGLLSRMPSSA